MPSFVFLELTDRELNYLFWTMAEIISGRRPREPMHLTVRGPYRGHVPEGVVRRCQETMRYDVLRIGDVGRFRNPREDVVFLRVDSPNLRKVWYKPDYPVGRYGFMPHISIYRGQDELLADLLQGFLAQEALDLECAEFRFVTQIARQGRLFSDEVGSSLYSFRKGKWRADFLDRLRALVGGYRGLRDTAPEDRP